MNTQTILYAPIKLNATQSRLVDMDMDMEYPLDGLNLTPVFDNMVQQLWAPRIHKSLSRATEAALGEDSDSDDQAVSVKRQLMEEFLTCSRRELSVPGAPVKPRAVLQSPRHVLDKIRVNLNNKW